MPAKFQRRGVGFWFLAHGLLSLVHTLPRPKIMDLRAKLNLVVETQKSILFLTKMALYWVRSEKTRDKYNEVLGSVVLLAK